MGKFDFERKIESGKPKIVQKENLEYVRQKYLQAIQDAQMLGEAEEVIRLQDEWQQKKAEFEK